MPPRPFCRYQLRTTHVAHAHAFYSAVFGEAHWSENVTCTPLPGRAAAAGAPPHWLGHIAVDDVDATLGHVLRTGGQPLGPRQRSTGALDYAPVRDPFGAGIAVSSRGATVPVTASTAARGAAGYHLLQAEDETRACAWYAETFGWTQGPAVDLGQRGRHRLFAWDASGRIAGSTSNIARLPHVHTAWLFFFSVPDIQAAADMTLRLGGKVVGISETANGDWISACDDPQGGAFGLYQARPAAASA